MQTKFAKTFKGTLKENLVMLKANLGKSKQT